MVSVIDSAVVGKTAKYYGKYMQVSSSFGILHLLENAHKSPRQPDSIGLHVLLHLQKLFGLNVPKYGIIIACYSTGLFGHNMCPAL